MTLEEAIRTAIEYETKIFELYQNAAETMSDPAGKRLFGFLKNDEAYHLKYLTQRLEEWQKKGRINVETLESSLPSKETIEKEMSKLKTRMGADDRKDEKQILNKALYLEVETSKFYRQMVNELSDEGKEMFARFLEIEDAHIDAVQAELDYLSKTGYWFDFKEFDMEGW